MIRARYLILVLFMLAACQTAPVIVPDVTPAPTPPAPVEQPSEPPVFVPPAPSETGYFDHLPGWQRSPILPALEAFGRSCTRIAKKSAEDALSDKAWWAGTAADWMPACAALDVVQDEQSARVVLESLFVPIEIQSKTGASRFTGYFEPTYQARRRPIHPYTEPVPALPKDLVPNGSKPLQRLRNGKTRPYPSRADITRAGVDAIAYAHPSDVFFMQIQGSGRLQFPDGSTVRAAYAAHNGHTFKSTANWLMSGGHISRGEASMQGIRAWMDRANPADVRRAMNYNPRFVFFSAQPEGDAALGPKGAQSVPLTPLGSVAVDTSIHPLGMPMFVQTTAPGLGGDWSGLLIAQDTGGAIKGAVRGDIYFGTGPDAGNRAGTMNAPGRMWALVPRRVAERLRIVLEGQPSASLLGTIDPAP